jgi:hypothetical protein
MPKRELYVGETVPVEIQVGLRPGLVASLNGLPTLNGDSFTLNKLPSQPEESQEVVNGKPYTVLTWHSALAAVKAGEFSVTVETPLTVRIRTAPRQGARLGRGLFDNSMLDDFFNDPGFQDFFGGATEKQITVTSEPDTIKALALPAEGRPAGFSGAVGNFEVSDEISAAQCSAGDPLTLRLKVTGAGNFDRVNCAMLGGVDGWRTYKPAAKFNAGDTAGYTGEKTFEQAVIATSPGARTLPGPAFSFFNPGTRRYETRQAGPLKVEVSSAVAAGLAPSPSAANPGPTPSGGPAGDGLRPDRLETDSTVATLLPLYFQPGYLAAQCALGLGLAAGFVILCLRQRRASDREGHLRRKASSAMPGLLAEMDAASAAGDSAGFFQSARAALQQRLSACWGVAPASITIAEIDARLNGDGAEIRRVFALADQAAYSGQHLAAADFQQWSGTIRDQINRLEAL